VPKSLPSQSLSERTPKDGRSVWKRNKKNNEWRAAMSELDQSRRFDRRPVTSGLPPINGHRETGPTGPVRAMKRLMQRSKLHPYSITSSARARSVGGTVSPMAPAQADQQVFHP